MNFKRPFIIACLLICIKNGSTSFMGNETSLRQNIADLLEGKLNFTDETLPFEADELLDSTPRNSSEYDFIIIGAGSTGATIASRLSGIQNITVLLIEAGGREYSMLDIPSLTLSFQSSDEVTWDYATESSDKYCLSNTDHQCVLPFGKVMEGSSTVSYQLATRGNRRDYDGWAEEVGDDSWSYNNMLKYFKKLENYKTTGAEVNTEYRNTDGPMPISMAENIPQITYSFIEAGKEMGYSQVDFNGPEQIGFAYFQMTILDDENWSTNRAYLRPAKDRKNLIVSQHSQVQKILVDASTKNAYGVRYLKNGETYEVKARKEIILSAGPINSPQILMLSGIGPRNHLSEMNIEVIKDAPVGENLIEHIRYERGFTYTVNDSSTFEVPNVLDPEDSSIKEYVNNKTGYLSVGLSLNALALLNVDNRTDLHPNIEILLTPGPIRISSTTTSTNTSQTYAIHPVSMRPRSRGKVLLRSNNPLDTPEVIANYLEDPDDVRVMIKGIRVAREIGETEALKWHGSELQSFTSDCDVHAEDSDEFWECELRLRTISAYHTVGTCKMGRENSTDAVVNSQLKVIGITGLRVADTSVIPNPICAHTNIPAIAIGEKAADLIKTEYGY